MEAGNQDKLGSSPSISVHFPVGIDVVLIMFDGYTPGGECCKRRDRLTVRIESLAGINQPPTQSLVLSDHYEISRVDPH